ncbi:MAG: hypothetical protein H0W83_00440 [Planctomycetes bacterium]|nr:hypothetical protein [Planctomycetota bacterium]
MTEVLKVPEGTSPPERTRRNVGMATWLLMAALVFFIAGAAVLNWTPIVLLMAPVFLLGSAAYAIMGSSSSTKR